MFWTIDVAGVLSVQHVPDVDRGREPLRPKERGGDDQQGRFELGRLAPDQREQSDDRVRSEQGEQRVDRQHPAAKESLLRAHEEQEHDRAGHEHRGEPGTVGDQHPDASGSCDQWDPA
ncbi:MAG TPA: hypothetical protein PKB03_09475 [Baekduia sp.]|nr:hypothetical protein [Baekduia sp.]